jgi:hypothetical protein
MYNIYITKVKNIRPAENADRLNLCEVFGNTTVVDKSVNETDLYVYLPVDGQISQEFGEVNNLFRKKDDAGNQIGGFIDPERRNIRAIRLRGNRSDGLVLPLSSLETFGDISTLKEGDIVTTFNGHVIAEKYIPRSNNGAHSHFSGNRTRKKKAPIAPLFAEHADTEQLAYNLGAFKSGDYVEITLKMHGTSQRTGYLPRLTGYKRTLWERITRKEGTPVYDYGYVSGTRRTVLEDYSGGYYGDNAFREPHSKVFEGKMHKGETVYYEVVGFTTSGQPIMGDADNTKLNDKEFVKQYGKKTVFSYGCKPVVSIDCDDLQSDIYVYRMTMTNPDGEVVEYTPDFMRYRCEQMGVKTVPLLWAGIIPENPGASYDYTITPGEWIQNKAEQYYDGPDPIGKTHVREGVVVRIVNRPKFTAFKTKNFSFKVLEGIIKAEAEAPDIEEAESLEVEE